jgi:sugar phosphate isomerase/epimerase
MCGQQEPRFIGLADYGLNQWEGGPVDLPNRLEALLEAGYRGVERLNASTEADLLYQAATMHRLGFRFATVRGPTTGLTLEWSAAMGCNYIWGGSRSKDFDTFCRHFNTLVDAATGWGLRVGLHNHLGTAVETEQQLRAFLERCPDAGLVFDTAHLAAAGGDAGAIAGEFADRLVAVHVKDWRVTDEARGLDDWPNRGRFCELGAGNIDLDNVAVLQAADEQGYAGPIFVEQDTHLRDPYLDLKHSRDVLRQGGY